MLRRIGAIFCETRPETIIRSDWRGEARKASEPKRPMSRPAVAVAIISFAQQARPNCAGQTELPRPQPTTLPRVVVRMFRPSDSASASTPNPALPSSRCGQRDEKDPDEDQHLDETEPLE